MRPTQDPPQAGPALVPALWADKAMSLTGQRPAQKPPKPIRCKAHLDFVRSKPCLICGRKPSEAHHIRLGMRTMGKRVCDSKTVPLDRMHHLDCHEGKGGELGFWQYHQIDPWVIAAKLWHERTGEFPPWLGSE